MSQIWKGNISEFIELANIHEVKTLLVVEESLIFTDIKGTRLMWISVLKVMKKAFQTG
ncbi:hypothetical protein [Algoriphagus antarcticus]|uniref:Uncharacterized protein n=1 Tax=Algoriphagus antarcticus TaxID=238540 RepID=A0A3E0DQN4_9BACT|nr:hypothetical protein [Algoriphagus antarcticus]REG85401.1 hypothetical protein C8N25_11390 [Algoriphagus antarcticus]